MRDVNITYKTNNLNLMISIFILQLSVFGKRLVSCVKVLSYAQHGCHRGNGLSFLKSPMLILSC